MGKLFMVSLKVLYGRLSRRSLLSHWFISGPKCASSHTDIPRIAKPVWFFEKNSWICQKYEILHCSRIQQVSVFTRSVQLRIFFSIVAGKIPSKGDFRLQNSLLQSLIWISLRQFLLCFAHPLRIFTTAWFPYSSVFCWHLIIDRGKNMTICG